jgi:hypothetical protein
MPPLWQYFSRLFEKAELVVTVAKEARLAVP